MLYRLVPNNKVEYSNNFLIYYAGLGPCYSRYEDDNDSDDDHIESTVPD